MAGLKARVMRNANIILDIHQKRRALRWTGAVNDTLESRVRRKSQARFGEGWLEKDYSCERHLADHLLYP